MTLDVTSSSFLPHGMNLCIPLIFYDFLYTYVNGNDTHGREMVQKFETKYTFFSLFYWNQRNGKKFAGEMFEEEDVSFKIVFLIIF